MRNLFWISCAVLVVSCADKSNADPHSAGSGAGGARITPAGNASDEGVTGPQTAGTGGARAIDAGRVVTRGSGAGGASATAGSGGQSERDAGEGDAGQRGHDAGQGGVGGPAGSGGSAATACDQLKTDYAAALHLAQTCDPRASAQCQQLAIRSLGCYCTTTVNDAAPLDDIKARYDDAGCPADPACRGIFCTSPGTGTCMSIDNGDLCN